MRLIDADALERSMNERHRTLVQLNGEYDHYVAGYGDAICEVEDIPTIDAEPVRHGKWLHPEEEDEEYHTVSCSCSVCGWKFNLYEDDIDGAPYCAVCGAKMEPVLPLYQTDEAEP